MKPKVKLIRLTWWEELRLMLSPVGPHPDCLIRWMGHRYEKFEAAQAPSEMQENNLVGNMA